MRKSSPVWTINYLNILWVIIMILQSVGWITINSNNIQIRLSHTQMIQILYDNNKNHNITKSKCNKRLEEIKYYTFLGNMVLTFVYNRYFVSVVYEFGEISQVVLFCEGFVVDLYEANSQLVCIIVNILEFHQHLGAFLAFWFI